MFTGRFLKKDNKYCTKKFKQQSNNKRVSYQRFLDRMMYEPVYIVEAYKKQSVKFK